MGEGLSKNGHFLLYNMWMAPKQLFSQPENCKFLHIGFMWFLDKKASYYIVLFAVCCDRNLMSTKMV